MRERPKDDLSAAYIVLIAIAIFCVFWLGGAGNSWASDSSNKERSYDRGSVDGDDIRSVSGSKSTSMAGADAQAQASGGAATAQGGEASAIGHGGAGGQGGAGGSAGVGNVSGGTSTSGGNSFDAGDNSYFALSVGAPNIDGCIVGGSVGGGGDSGGGLFQWGRLNHDCFMNEIADAERHIETRARLKCASDHYRRAITFDLKGSKIEKTQACIDYSVTVWAKEIDYLRELMAQQEVMPGK